MTENSVKEYDRKRKKIVVQTAICLVMLVALGLGICFVGAKQG
jgi:hypothetical protein